MGVDYSYALVTIRPPKAETLALLNSAMPKTLFQGSAESLFLLKLPFRPLGKLATITR